MTTSALEAPAKTAGASSPTSPAATRRRILAFATQGIGHGEEHRIRELLREFPAEVFPFDRQSKLKSALRLLREIRSSRPDLVVMEGTGSAGGLAIVLARLLFEVPYVVSSGDAVAPFLTAIKPMLGPVFRVYERALCRYAAGFIGWTPYLAGRAMTLGAPRAMTAPGWAPFPRTRAELADARARVREQWGVPRDAIVFGIVGTMAWNRRVRYCYGLELARAALQATRPDLRVLIVGDGSGRSVLDELARSRPGAPIILTGRVPREQVPDYLAAMDVGSLPQSVDGVGSFRYTTKVSEYLEASLPVATGRIPLGYDLDTGWIWRLPGLSPWDPSYVSALASLMDSVTPEQIARKRAHTTASRTLFDKEEQIARVTAFISELLDDRMR